jgi:hypothetical protein
VLRPEVGQRRPVDVRLRVLAVAAVPPDPGPVPERLPPADYLKNRPGFVGRVAQAAENFGQNFGRSIVDNLRERGRNLLAKFGINKAFEDSGVSDPYEVARIASGLAMAKTGNGRQVKAVIPLGKSPREMKAFHERAAACMASLAEDRATWAIPWPCLHEFFAIVTHPRIYAPPTPEDRALDQVDAWLESPTLVLLADRPADIADDPNYTRPAHAGDLPEYTAPTRTPTTPSVAMRPTICACG